MERFEKRALCLTEEEVEECRDIFAKLDWNRNGSIGVEDMRRTLEHLGYYPNDQEVQSIMGAITLKRGGSIDENEFIEFMEFRFAYKRTMSQNDRELKQAFDLFDEDGDGFVSTESLVKLVREFGFDMGREELGEMIHELRPKEIGRINFEEFQRLMNG
jgi:calmodulin